jgi:hypothetical protein
VPVGTTVNGQYYCSLLQDKVGLVGLALCHKQPELPKHGVILLQDSARPQCHDVQNPVQHQEWDVLAHALYSPDLAITGYLHVRKNIFGVNDLNLMMIATLLTLHLDII